MKRRATLTGLLTCALVLLLAGAATAGNNKVNVCHVPPGNPANFHTITISENALQAHLGHGDLAGECSAHCSQLCDDGNACTVDACDASGHCAASHPPVSCDDGNLCTTDTCNPATGCSGAPRTCTDADLCTVNSCDPLTGDCVFPAVACDPGETCNPANGNCEANGVDECASDPCLHGLCVDQNNGFVCQCSPGYTGTFCQTEIDECESNPCQNGAECIDQVDAYLCICPEGYTGTNCEIPPAP